MSVDFCWENDFGFVYDNLEKNDLTKYGADFVSKANWKNLIKIHLSRNVIGEKGA